MSSRSRLVIAMGATIGLLPVCGAMAGIDLTAGDWKLDFSGNVNAFYVGTSCDSGSNTDVTGGLACTGDRSAAVRNGLLPAALVFAATTQQEGLDIGVTIGLYPGINSSAAAGVNGAGLPAALATPGIDARQAFLTFGNPSWGTVKMGRDIGLFGKDAILDDMTLLGVGSAPNNAAPSNTSLGRIGLGYIYTDWEPQITYTTPTYSGFSASAGIFQPLDAVGSASYTKHSQPQIQIGGSYAWGDANALTGKVWLDFVTQQYQASAADQSGNNAACGCVAASSQTGNGVDAGVKLGYQGFEGVLYGYTGSGLGTTGLFILGTSASGGKRDSDGGYVQAAYKFQKLKIGLSYGMSELKRSSDERALAPSNLLKRNSSVVGGLYYSLTKSLTLVGEYIDTKADAWNGNSAHEHDFAIGGILFF
ncbi:MAG: porin [Gammaproteobacteria bacterium]|nr:porin [Gammaproteobacteria bacterium]